MHAEALAFLSQSVRALGLGDAGRVIEFGSYDVNGSPRPLFSTGDYIGVDMRPGPRVTVVADAATVKLPPADVVVCSETLEHAVKPERLIKSARRLLRPGGWLLITCAAPERTPHGCDGGAIPPGEHYGHVSPADLTQWLAGWSNVSVEHYPQRGDLYAIARKPLP